MLHGEGGIRPNPVRFQSIVDQPTPTTVGHVYTGMSVLGWSRSFIPNFAVLEHPVRAFVMARLGAGRKSKQRADRMALADSGWTPELQVAYDKLRLSVVESVRRAYRDPDKVVCLVWDASKYAWSYTITQAEPDELAKPWADQQHQMLVTRSGIFKNAQLR